MQGSDASTRHRLRAVTLFVAAVDMPPTAVFHFPTPGV